MPWQSSVTSQREAGCHISIPAILCGELSVLQSYYRQVEYQSRKIKSFSTYCQNLQHMNTHKLSPQTPFTSRFTGWPRWGSWKNLSVTQKVPSLEKVTTLIGKSITTATWGNLQHTDLCPQGLPRTSFFWNHSRYSNPFLAAPKSVGLLGWIFTTGLLRTCSSERNKQPVEGFEKLPFKDSFRVVSGSKKWSKHQHQCRSRWNGVDSSFISNP